MGIVRGREIERACEGDSEGKRERERVSEGDSEWKRERKGE